jgi:hypothetical protein
MVPSIESGRGVRVKRCGKSAPPRQRWRGQGKPHTVQDQIGREFAVALSVFQWMRAKRAVFARNGRGQLRGTPRSFA